MFRKRFEESFAAGKFRKQVRRDTFKGVLTASSTDQLSPEWKSERPPVCANTMPEEPMIIGHFYGPT